MRNTKALAVLAFLLLEFGGVIPAQSSIINGGFESGDFSGYTVYYPAPFETLDAPGVLHPFGYAEVVTNLPSFQPHGGNYFAALSGVGFGDSVLAPFGQNDKVTVSTNAYMPSGSLISGWSAVLDSAGGGQPAWVKIFNSNGELVATPWEFHQAPTRASYYVEYAWANWNWTSKETGWYKLELGMDLGLVYDSNYAMFDDIRVIPEPSTLLLLGSGLVGLIGYGRRRIRK